LQGWHWENVLFWTDKWHDKGKFCTCHPHLFYFEKDKRIPLHKVFENMGLDIFELFNLPPSLVAMDECNIMTTIISAARKFNSIISDSWSFLGNNLAYPTKKVYLSLINPPVAPAPYKWVSKSACLPKQKFFFWVMTQDRLNTKDLLTRKNFTVDSKLCVLCDVLRKQCSIFSLNVTSVEISGGELERSGTEIEHPILTSTKL
jgi:hypothetical protein